MVMTRATAAQQGQEAVRITEQGYYRTAAGITVSIADLMKRAVEKTRSYPPEKEIPSPAVGRHLTKFEVKNESTLAAARALATTGRRPVALNFASAKHPGGGFLTGARAQEESLARSSGLHACLVGNAMYDYHRAQADPMYSNYAVYSPDVPVFRDDAGALLPEPYLCSFITSPAINAKIVLERDSRSRPAIRQAMQERIEKVLSLAAMHNHEVVILGAWGCGVFGNDCREIAELFHYALTGAYRGVFSHVVFAILDWSHDQHFIEPFVKQFAEV